MDNYEETVTRIIGQVADLALELELDLTCSESRAPTLDSISELLTLLTNDVREALEQGWLVSHR